MDLLISLVRDQTAVSTEDSSIPSLKEDDYIIFIWFSEEIERTELYNLGVH